MTTTTKVEYRFYLQSDDGHILGVENIVCEPSEFSLAAFDILAKRPKISAIEIWSGDKRLHVCHRSRNAAA